MFRIQFNYDGHMTQIQNFLPNNVLSKKLLLKL